VEEWQARHRSYEEQGIADVWLFGHLAPHLRAAAGVVGVIEVELLHQEMTRAGVVPLWINPVEEKVGTAWVERRVHQCRQAPRDHTGADKRLYAIGRLEAAQRAFFGTDDLADCLLTPEGLVTPTGRRIAASETAYDRAVEAEEQRLAREAAEAQRRAEELRARRDAQQAGWEDSPLRQWLLRRFGAIPTVLSVDLPHAGGVLAWPEFWHAALYWKLVRGKPAGSTFTIEECYATLDCRYSFELSQVPSERRGAVVEFLEHLEREGLLELVRSAGSPWWMDEVRIVADLDLAGRTPAEGERERTRARAAERAPRRAGEVEARRPNEWRERYDRKLDYLARKNTARSWGKKGRPGRPPASPSGDQGPWEQLQLGF
jgi:hypothetical protein